MTNKEPLIKFESRDHVAIITLNRPQAMNAVSAELALDLEAALERFEADSDLWIAILASSHPKTFCAGADLKSISAGKSLSTPKGGFAGFVAYPRRKPIIAAVDGFALAGGCELVLTCDLVVATENSEFGVPEVKRSLVAAAGGLFRLPRQLPYHIAMEMILTGDRIGCKRMYELGFVNVIAEKGKVLEAAMTLAKRVTVNAPLAVVEARRVVVETLSRKEEELGWEESAKSFPALAKTADFKEGPRAFIEKRAPKWTGKL